MLSYFCGVSRNSISAIERGLRKGYWDKALIPELKKRFKELEKKEKLLEIYKRAYDNANAEVLKMFTYEQDEKTTLTNIIGHLDDSKTVVQIKELENGSEIQTEQHL
jgi:hypothetical protein